MARRLTPEARRAEIIEVAHAVISDEGYRALSLRELARRCGMSAPGLMHYFPDMRSLLDAVLEHRDEQDLAAMGVMTDTNDQPLDQKIEEALRYYEIHSDESRRFDVLEVEALDPSHPAHEFFQHRDDRNMALIRPHFEREFVDPDAAIQMFRLVLDGLWLRSVRNPHQDRVEAWREVQHLVFAGLERRKSAESSVS